MKTSEQKLTEKLEKAISDLKVTRKRCRVARRLLDASIDAIPDYSDGRNDKLCNAIIKWLDEPCTNSTKNK